MNAKRISKWIFFQKSNHVIGTAKERMRSEMEWKIKFLKWAVFFVFFCYWKITIALMNIIPHEANAQKLRTKNPWNGIVNFYSTDKFKAVKHALHLIFIRISIHKSHRRRVKHSKENTHHVAGEIFSVRYVRICLSMLYSAALHLEKPKNRLTHLGIVMLSLWIWKSTFLEHRAATA